jgi:excisionase family DNA binding protein
MTGPNKERVAEKGLDLETGLSGAKLTAVEVATLLRIHLTTVYKMAKRGDLPGFKIASDWRFDPSQIDGWVRSRMQGPGAEEFLGCQSSQSRLTSVRLTYRGYDLTIGGGRRNPLVRLTPKGAESPSRLRETPS